MLVFITVLIQYHVCGQAEAQAPLMIDRALLDAIKQVESGGDPCAIGDNGQSLGAYQITKGYYSDALQYNPHLGDGARTYSDVWGIGSEAYAEEVIACYMGRYATPERLGRQPTYEDIARIHNGGPNGYQRSSTLHYWESVMKKLAKQRSGHQIQNINNHCSPACTAGQCCSSMGSCNCLSSTFTIQSCTESGTGTACGQICESIIVIVLALLCLMAQFTVY